MKHEHSSKTAEVVAAIRATELYQLPSDRLFEDPYAKMFLRPILRFSSNLCRYPLLRSLIFYSFDWKFPGTIYSVLGRTRYIDDMLNYSISDGLEQVVILGAGLDSRGYRLPGINKVRVFEVDHPVTQRLKIQCLQKKLDSLPLHVTFVPLDFEKVSLETALLDRGFQKKAKTFFIWEGVIMYLTKASVENIFNFITKKTARDNQIVFTYFINMSVKKTATKEYDKQVSFLNKLEESVVHPGFSPEELRGYLVAQGLELLDDLGGQDFQIRYPIIKCRNLLTNHWHRVAFAKVCSSG